jgi:uncharacterized surface protein with fasciclin (FAS1) repeats
MFHYATLPRAVALAVPITLGAWTAQAADIIQTAEQAGHFNGFLRMLEAADMVDVLEDEGPLTVFAPTDEAFARLPPGMLDRLLAEENRKPLEAVIQSHIVADAAILAGDLLGQAVEVATLAGGTLAIDGTTGIIALAPIEPSVTEVEGQTAVDPTSAATPVSVIVARAPHDSAPAADRPATPAEQELLGVATVVEPDIGADNGVIHGIDLVLLPPEALWSF